MGELVWERQGEYDDMVMVAKELRRARSAGSIFDGAPRHS